MTRWRTTLIDPAVDPAEPPGNMRATIRARSAGASRSHSLKSVLANPVVVMIETVWKAAFADRLLAVADARVPEDHGEDDGGQQHQAEVEPELLVVGERDGLPAHEGLVEEREVRAGDRHEHGDHPPRAGA